MLFDEGALTFPFTSDGTTILSIVAYKVSEWVSIPLFMIFICRLMDSW